MKRPVLVIFSSGNRIWHPTRLNNQLWITGLYNACYLPHYRGGYPGGCLDMVKGMDTLYCFSIFSEACS